MADLGSLTARIGLDTTGLAAGVAVARGELAALNTSGSNSLRALQTVGAAAFLGLAAAAGIVGTASVLAAADFESAMLRVRTQAGASQGEVDLMTEAILRMAQGLGTSPNALADALFRIESTGIRGAEALELLELAAMGAQVGAADLTEVTMGLLAMINSHIEGVGSQSQAMGILNGIVGISNVTMGELAHALGTGVLPAAAAAGVSIQELGAAFGVLTSTGLPAEVAANRLRTTIALMSAPTIDAQKAFEELGLGSFELAETLQRDGLIAAIELLKTSLENSGLTATQQADIIRRAFGGGEMSSTILTLLGNFDMLVAKEAELGAGAQNFADSWEATKETFAFQMDQMKVAVEVLAIRIGTVLIPVVTRMAEALADAVDWLKEHEAVAIALAAVIGGALVAAMGAFVVGLIAANALVIAVGAAIGALAVGIALAYEKFGNVVGVLLLLVSPLAAVAAGVLLLVRNFDDMVAALQRIPGQLVTLGAAIMDGLWLGIQSGWDVILNFFRGLPLLIVAAVGDAATWLKDLGIDALAGLVDGLTAALPFLFNWFTDLPGRINGAVGDAASWLKDLGVKAVLGFIAGLESVVVGVFNWFRDLPGKITSAIGSATDWLKEHGVEAILGFIQGLADGAEFVLIWVRDELPKKLAAGMATAVEWLREHGPKIIEGLINGIKEAMDNPATVLKIVAAIAGGLALVALAIPLAATAIGIAIIAGLLIGIASEIPKIARLLLIDIPKGLGEVILSAGGWLVGAGVALMGGLWQGAQVAWDLVLGWFKNLGGLILSAIGDAPNWLYQTGVDILSGLGRGISVAWEFLWGWFKNLGSLIGGAFLDAGTWLWNTGIDIVLGLLRGLQSAWDQVPSWLQTVLFPVKAAFEGLEAVINRLEGARISVNTELTGADLNEVAAQVERIVLLLQEMSNLGGGGGMLAPPGSFATGGRVPGNLGAPALAVVHGGEQILTRSQQRAQDLVGAGSPMAATSTAGPTSQSSTTQYILQGDIVANDPAELERQLAARARLSNLTSAA